MKVTIEFSVDDSDFAGDNLDSELYEVLVQQAKRMAYHAIENARCGGSYFMEIDGPSKLRSTNGNTIGTVTIDLEGYEPPLHFLSPDHDHTAACGEVGIALTEDINRTTCEACRREHEAWEEEREA